MLRKLLLLLLLPACTVPYFKPDTTINKVGVDWGAQPRQPDRLLSALEACELLLTAMPGGSHPHTVTGSGAKIKFVPAYKLNAACLNAHDVAGCYWLESDLVILAEDPSGDIWKSAICHEFAHRGAWERRMNQDYSHSEKQWWDRVQAFHDLAQP